MDSLGQHLNHAVRRLARAPLFTTVSVLTLAVGIGATVAIFTVVHAVLLEPLPFEEPERLVGVWHTAPGLGFDEVNQSPALHFTYAAEATAFESVGAWDDSQVTVTGLAEPKQVAAMYVTHQTLPLLGVQPALGRTFTPEEDAPDGAQAAMLSHGYWERRPPRAGSDDRERQRRRRAHDPDRNRALSGRDDAGHARRRPASGRTCGRSPATWSATSVTSSGCCSVPSRSSC